MKIVLLTGLLLLAVGCASEEVVPLHADVVALSKVNPYVAIAIVLRDPLYVVAIAGLIFAVATLAMTDNTRKKLKEKGEHHAQEG